MIISNDPNSLLKEVHDLEIETQKLFSIINKSKGPSKHSQGAKHSKQESRKQSSTNQASASETPRKTPTTKPNFPTTKLHIDTFTNDFENEKSRIVDGKDSFIPSPNVKLSDLHAEMSRLENLEKNQRNRQFNEKISNQKWLQQRICLGAALTIQRAFRGHIGRKKAQLQRSIQSIQEKAVNNWVEIRDNDSGDCWYYNIASGESQWDRPVSLEPAEASLPNISAVTSKGPRPSVSFPQYQSNSILPSISGTTDYQAEINDALGISVKDDARSALFSCDGRSNRSSMRKLVKQALQVSKFDSVSSLLSDYQWSSNVNQAIEPASRTATPSFSSTFLSPKEACNTQKLSCPITAGSKPPQISPKNPKTAVDLNTRQIRGSQQEAALSSSLDTPEQAGLFDNHVCFACWSAGYAQKCSLHSDPKKKLVSSESMILCRNWDIGYFRRKHRSEEIQELFSKNNVRLKYDPIKRTLTPSIAVAHPIYRVFYQGVTDFNQNYKVFRRAVSWSVSIGEMFRMGLLKQNVTKVKSQVHRDDLSWKKSQKMKMFQLKFQLNFPSPPVTGKTLPEIREEVRVIRRHKFTATGTEEDIVEDGPIPKPKCLYVPRSYLPVAPYTIPFPIPETKDIVLETSVKISHDLVVPHGEASWIQKLSQTSTRVTVKNTIMSIQRLTPASLSKTVLQKVKVPPPFTIRFASVQRREVAASRNCLGGLPMQLLLKQFINSEFPAQYGEFTKSECGTIQPNAVSENIAYKFPCLLIHPFCSPFNYRPLRHALDLRRAPPIRISHQISKKERYFFGQNVPDVTGEHESYGFRTSCWCEPIKLNQSLDVSNFTPSSEIATTNQPNVLPTSTTHSDRHYPFCQVSSRDNTTLDFYHLLLTGTCSMNKHQVFTTLTSQDPGEFMMMSDNKKPLGCLTTMVYRSWAYCQKNIIEEFKSDDGVPYFYNRKTGESYWERPVIAEEEMKTILDGGIRKEANHTDMPSIASHNPNFQDELKYTQGDVRNKMVLQLEDEKSAVKRRKSAYYSLKSNLSSLSGVGDADEIKEEGSRMTEDDDDHDPDVPEFPKSGSIVDSDVFSSKSKVESSSKVFNQSNEAIRETIPPKVVSQISDAVCEAMKLTSDKDSKLSQAEALFHIGVGIGMSMSKPMQPTAIEQTQVNSDIESHSLASISVSSKSTSKASSIKPIKDVAKATGKAFEGTGHLNHADDTSQSKESRDLTSMEKAQHLKFSSKPTFTPDEAIFHRDTMNQAVKPNAEEAARNMIPLVARTSTAPPDFLTHGPAGVGITYQAEVSVDDGFLATKDKNIRFRTLSDRLPIGFFKGITATHVARQSVGYLPVIPNLPQSRALGRVNARSAAEDWLAVGFDPWSSGRDPLSVEYVLSLAVKAEELGIARKAASVATGAGQSEADVLGPSEMVVLEDTRGIANDNLQKAIAARQAGEFRMLCSHVRHGKFAEIEETLNQVDWTLPINHQDEAGNSLLHIAAQNGNKRICKLLLRKGANVNLQNLNGQICLHFAFSYAFDDLGNYLISKGGDDSLRNAEGLTCYEGLSKDSFDQL